LAFEAGQTLAKPGAHQVGQAAILIRELPLKLSNIRTLFHDISPFRVSRNVRFLA
jgi:hypothetical protein